MNQHMIQLKDGIGVAGMRRNAQRCLPTGQLRNFTTEEPENHDHYRYHDH